MKRKVMQVLDRAYLVGGHLADRVSGLQGLQLVQAPVQLLQGLGGQLLVGLLWKGERGGERQGVSPEPLQGASRGRAGRLSLSSAYRHVVGSSWLNAWAALHAEAPSSSAWYKGALSPGRAPGPARQTAVLTSGVGGGGGGGGGGGNPEGRPRPPMLSHHQSPHNDSTHSTEGADAGRGERVLCPETHTHTQGKHTVFSHREAVLLTHPHEHSQHTQAQIVTVQSGAVNVVDPVHCSGRSCFQSS